MDKTTKQWLNTKQELFVLEFLKDLNATRAYKEVYKTTQKVSEVNGCKLLSNTKVKEFIEEKLTKRFARAEKDWQRVIDRLFELVERVMQRVPVMVYDKELKEHVQATNENWEWVWQFDSSWANTALANLAKYFKLFTETVKVEGWLTITWEWQK